MTEPVSIAVPGSGRTPAAMATGALASHAATLRAAVLVAVISLGWSSVAAVFLPLIQDDGWNAAIVLSKIRRGDAFAETPVPGFVTNAYRAYYSVAYHGLQEGLVRAFGDSYFVFRLNTVIGGALAAWSLFFILLRLTGSAAAGVFSSLIFCFHPLFWVHANNRNEMFAAGVALACLALLIDTGLAERPAGWRTGLAYFLPFVAFDVHPISVMLVVGYGCYLFFTTRVVIPAALAGAAAGVVYLIFSKTRVTGDFTALAALLGLSGKTSSVELIDHYIPLFNFQFGVAIAREKVRLTPFLKIGAVSCLWIIAAARFREMVREKSFRIVLIVIGSMWIFSVLFFDQAGNGYFLYVWAAFMIGAGYLAFEGVRWLAPRVPQRLLWIAVSIPLALLIVRGGLQFYKPAVQRYAKYRAAYEAIPATLNLQPGEVVAARPTFWFLFYKSPNRLVHQFLATLVMKRDGVGFIDAWHHLGASVVGLDEMELNTFWFADKAPRDASLGAFYNQLPRITSKEFAGYVQSGVLRPLATFDDPTHGHTTFYRIDYAKAGKLPPMAISAQGAVAR
jgi:hypothetical protein